MAELDDTVEEVLAGFDGTETYDEAEYALRDYSSKEISVNAAKLAVAGGGAPGGGGGWPTLAFLDAAPVPVAHTDFAGRGKDSDNVTRFSTGGADSWIEFPLALRGGTWSLDVTHLAYGDGGTLSFELDDGDGLVAIDAAPYSASGADADTYAAEIDSLHTTRVAADITIPASGYYTLRGTITGKNASSGGFEVVFYFMHLLRVGD